MPSLSKFHKELVGGDPTPEQQRLYEAFPEFKGYSKEEHDKYLLVATFILGLHQTKNSQKVSFFVPRSHDALVIETINELLKEIKQKRAKLPNKGLEGNRQIVKAIQNIEIGSRVFTVKTEPERWIAYGFSITTPAPEWLTTKLLV